MISVVCVSDLHGYLPPDCEGDLLIVAGDLTATDKFSEYNDFFSWFSDQNFKKKILVGGNHDGKLSQGISKSYYPFMDYLEDSGTEFENLKIWATPWTLWFDGINPKCKAFTGSEAELRAKFMKIPDDIDILICHGPPFGILDEVEDRETGKIRHVGSVALREALDRIKPKLMVFGHIHEQGGKEILYKHSGPNTLCINCSYVDERYRRKNKPVRLEMKI